MSKFSKRYHLHIPTMSLRSFEQQQQTATKDAASINQLVDITYTNDTSAVCHWMKNYLETVRHPIINRVPLGFDIEWRPNTRKGDESPPAVLQLSAAEGRQVLLVQLLGTFKGDGGVHEFFKMNLGKDPVIRRYLCDPMNMKLGVGIENDLKILGRRHKLDFNLSNSHSKSKNRNEKRGNNNDNDDMINGGRNGGENEMKQYLDMQRLAKFHYEVQLFDTYGQKVLDGIEKYKSIISNPSVRMKLHHRFKVPLIEVFDFMTAGVSKGSSREDIEEFLQELDGFDTKTFVREHMEYSMLPSSPNSAHGTIILPVPVNTVKCGLQALGERYLKLYVGKGGSTQQSNWEQFPLNSRQIIYAALDAHISEKCFHEIMNDLEKRKLFERGPSAHPLQKSLFNQVFPFLH